MNNRVKLLPLAELGGLPRQLRANVDTLGVKLGIGLLEPFSDVDTLALSL